MQTWKSVNDYLDKLLEQHSFTFDQVVKSIGCGERTLRRYMEAQYVEPIKKSDEWLFSQAQVKKCWFMHALKTKLNMQVPLAAGLYDFLAENLKTIDTDSLIDKMSRYKYGETDDTNS